MSRLLLVLALLSFFVNISAQAAPPTIEDLDDDHLWSVFSYVTKLKDNRSLALTNRIFNRIANDPQVFEYIKFEPHELKAYSNYQKTMKGNSGAFQVLPEESIFRILTYLIPGKESGLGLNHNPKELYSVSRTCKFFKKSTHSPRLWTNVKFDIDTLKINPRMFPVRYIRLLLIENCGYRASRSLMNAIKRLPCSLSELNLQFCCLEDPDREDFWLSALHVHALPHLEVLHLGNTEGTREDIIDSDMAYIAKCSNLKVLHLTSLDKITPEGLSLLRPLTNLKKIELYWVPQIKKNDVERSLPRLQECNINGTLFSRHETTAMVPNQE